MGNLAACCKRKVHPDDENENNNDQIIVIQSTITEKMLTSNSSNMISTNKTNEINWNNVDSIYHDVKSKQFLIDATRLLSVDDNNNNQEEKVPPLNLKSARSEKGETHQDIEEERRQRNYFINPRLKLVRQDTDLYAEPEQQSVLITSSHTLIDDIDGDDDIAINQNLAVGQVRSPRHDSMTPLEPKIFVNGSLNEIAKLSSQLDFTKALETSISFNDEEVNDDESEVQQEQIIEQKLQQPLNQSSTNDETLTTTDYDYYMDYAINQVLSMPAPPTQSKRQTGTGHISSDTYQYSDSGGDSSTGYYNRLDRLQSDNDEYTDYHLALAPQLPPILQLQPQSSSQLPRIIKSESPLDDELLNEAERLLLFNASHELLSPRQTPDLNRYEFKKIKHLEKIVESEISMESERPIPPREESPNIFRKSLNGVALGDEQHTNGKHHRDDIKVVSLSSMHNIEENYDINQSIDHPAYDTISDWLNVLSTLLGTEPLVTYALSKSREEFNSFKELKDFLKNSVSSDPLHKAWIIYVWICHNIDYDLDAYRLGRNVFKTDMTDKSDLSAEDVFYLGKAIYLGFSDLYTELCTYAGIECISITGYAKDFSYKPTEVAGQLHTNHSWNAIKINNKWEVVDVAWGSGFGQLKLKSSLYAEQNDFNPYYFLVPGEIFIFDHYSKFYQFQMNRIEYLQAFINMNNIKNRYFIDGIKCLTSDVLMASSSLIGIANEFQLNFKMEFLCGADIGLTATLTNTDDEEDLMDQCVLIQKSFIKYKQNKPIYEINVSLKPNVHTSQLNLFSYKLSGSDSQRFWCSSFYYTNTKTTVNSIWRPLCKTFILKPELATDVYLVKPLESNLNLNEFYEFVLFVTSTEHNNVELTTKVLNVALIDSENNFYNFTRSIDDSTAWSIKHYCNMKGELSVSIRINDDETVPFYSRAILYEVI